jgi:hypothetical protein
MPRPLRFGFNPRLLPTSRPAMAKQLAQAVHVATQLGFEVIELTLTEPMYELGLRTVFGGELLELMQTAPLQFHLHLFYGHDGPDEVGISDTNALARSRYLRRLTQVIEYFEANRPIRLYVIHSGARTVGFESHLESLLKSYDVIQTMFPGIPVAIETGRPGSVLESPFDFITFLEACPWAPFVFDPALAYQTVYCNRELFTQYLRALSKFTDRLVEIHWSNTAPGLQTDRPLHIPLEGGIDFELVMTLVGRNPATYHVLETVATSPAALARDRRVLLAAAVV